MCFSQCQAFSIPECKCKPERAWLRFTVAPVRKQPLSPVSLTRLFFWLSLALPCPLPLTSLFFQKWKKKVGGGTRSNKGFHYSQAEVKVPSGLVSPNEPSLIGMYVVPCAVRRALQPPATAFNRIYLASYSPTSTAQHLPSPFSRLPSPFSRLPSPIFLLPSPVFFLPSPVSLPPSPLSRLQHSVVTCASTPTPRCPSSPCRCETDISTRVAKLTEDAGLPPLAALRIALGLSFVSHCEALRRNCYPFRLIQLTRSD